MCRGSLRGLVPPPIHHVKKRPTYLLSLRCGLQYMSTRNGTQMATGRTYVQKTGKRSYERSIYAVADATELLAGGSAKEAKDKRNYLLQKFRADGGGKQRWNTAIPLDKYIYQNKTKTRQRPVAARGHIFPKPHTHPFLKHTQVMTRGTPCSHSSRHPPHASKVSQCARGTKSCTIHPKMKHIQARAVILSDDAGPSTALALATDALRVQRAIGETRHCPHAAQSHSKHQRYSVRAVVWAWSVQYVCSVCAATHSMV